MPSPGGLARTILYLRISWLILDGVRLIIKNYPGCRTHMGEGAILLLNIFGVLSVSGDVLYNQGMGLWRRK